MKDLQQNKRKTIGVLVNSVDGFYQSLILKGIKKSAELDNNNLIIFSGGALKSQLYDEAQHNSIYRIVNVDKLDGLILSSAVLSNFVNQDEFLEFIKQYRKIPIVSIGIAIEGITSLLFDNKNSMHKLVDHLIEQHKYSKIGFITGPGLSIDALERLHGYEESLEKHNIPIDRNLIVEGNYTMNSGSNAIDIFIKDKGVRPEVIVASNDEMALGACIRMKQIGYEAGIDIAVTGFDNIESVRTFSPSITTVSQNIFKMASKATEILSDLIDGKEIAMCSILSGEVIIRESCGCFNIKTKEIRTMCEKPKIAIHENKNEIFESNLKFKQDVIINFMVKKLQLPQNEIPMYKGYLNKLFAFFIIDIESENKFEGEFFQYLKEILNESINIKKYDCLWNEALENMRDYIFECINSRVMHNIVEEMFCKAKLITENILLKREAAIQFNFKRMYIGIRHIMKGFNSATYLEQLTQVVQDALSWYGIKECYLCLYDNPIKSFSPHRFNPPTSVKLVLGYNEGKLAEVQYFKTDEMLPNQFIYSDKRSELIFFSLFFGEDQFGYIVWDMNAIDEYIFETFREHISNTLKIQMLFNDREKVDGKLSLAVSELAKLNDELRGRTLVDELTGLYNRRGFYKTGEKFHKSTSVRDEKFILCFGDIDNLKMINDTFGHEEGDEAIFATAQLLKKSFRNDDIVARLGGDEFTMIAKNSSSDEDIKSIMKRINRNFDDYNLVSKKSYSLSISIGFSVYTPSTNYSFKELISQADEKLYEQKKKYKSIIR